MVRLVVFGRGRHFHCTGGKNRLNGGPGP
jgi:hypothetical protein